MPRNESLSSTRRTGKAKLPDPAGRNSRLPRLGLDVRDFLLVSRDFSLDAIELGERLLPLGGHHIASRRVVDVHEVSRQNVNPALKGLSENLRTRQRLAFVGDPLLPFGFS